MRFVHVKRGDLGSSAAVGSPLSSASFRSFLALKASVVVPNTTPFLVSAPPLAAAAPLFWLQVVDDRETMI